MISTTVAGNGLSSLRLALVSVFSIVSVGLAGLVPAHATCGSTACFLVTDTREGINAAGRLRVDVSFRYTDQDRMLSGSSKVDEVLTPAVNLADGELELDHHREISTRSTVVQVDMSYGLTDRLGLVGSLPLYNDKYHEHYDEVGTPDEHFTNADGTRGLGDLQLGARYALMVRPRDLLIGGLSIKLPTGPYRILDSEGAINEPTIQPGSGSTDWIGSLHYSHRRSLTAPEWFASGSYRLDTENDLNYRIGGESLLGLGVSRAFGGKSGPGRLLWSVQVNVRQTARDEFLGEKVPSTGSTLVNLTPGLRLERESGSALYGYVQLPVHQDVNEAQLAPRWGLVLGVSRVF